jgi:hypothetical protein
MKLKNRALRWCRSETAYTLAEVLVGLLLIAVVAISLFAAFSAGFAVAGLQREDLRATQIMMRKLEGIRLCTWSQLPATISFAESYDPTGVSNNTAGTVYTGTLSTNSVLGLIGPTTYANNMRLVTVTVNWTNYSSGTSNSSFGKPLARSRTMQTFAARYGMQNYLWGAQ